MIWELMQFSLWFGFVCFGIIMVDFVIEGLHMKRDPGMITFTALGGMAVALIMALCALFALFYGDNI